MVATERIRLAEVDEELQITRQEKEALRSALKVIEGENTRLRQFFTLRETVNQRSDDIPPSDGGDYDSRRGSTAETIRGPPTTDPPSDADDTPAQQSPPISGPAEEPAETLPAPHSQLDIGSPTHASDLPVESPWNTRLS